MQGDIASIASGLEVSFYKDLGSAYATMNVSELHLPTWLPEMTSSERVQQAEELLDEHVDLIQHISNAKGEEGAEEYELLRFYRDFLSGDNLAPFWQFTTAYSAYLMSARERGRFMPQITTRGLENLLMEKKEHGISLTEITQNPGFRRVASAISALVAPLREENTRGRDIPRPYVITPPLAEAKRYEAREAFTFGVTLFGSIVQLLPYGKQLYRCRTC